MMEEIEKEKIKKISIASGILLFFFLTLLLFLILSRASWNKGLKKTLEQFLEKKYPETYIVDSALNIGSGFSTSSCAFKITENKFHGERIAVIINITTLYGSYPAVFLSQTDHVYKFAGFIGMPENFEDFAVSASMKSSIYFWQKRIPSIVNKKGK